MRVHTDRKRVDGAAIAFVVITFLTVIAGGHEAAGFCSGGSIVSCRNACRGAACHQQPAFGHRQCVGFERLMHELSDDRYHVLFAELRRLGQIEGQNLTVERYGREENTSDAAALAAHVVRSNPYVIYVIVPGIPFFKRETAKIPIAALTGDPVAGRREENAVNSSRS